MKTFPGFIGAALLCFAITACGRSAPDPPTVTPPVAGETITGSERIGWDQRAGDNAELATIRYVAYVDGARNELAEVSCAAAATANGYACTAPLPRMTAGAHTIEIASFVQDGSLFESARSAPLRVTVVGITVAEPLRSGASASARARGAAEWP